MDWVILQYVLTMSRKCRLLITCPLNLQIQLTPAQTFERDEIGCSTPYSRMSLTPQPKMASTTNSPVASTEQTPCSQFRVLAIKASPSTLSSQTGLIDMAQFTEVCPSPFKPQLLIFTFHLCLSLVSRMIELWFSELTFHLNVPAELKGKTHYIQ